MLRLQKGRNYGLKYSHARMTAITFKRVELSERPSLRVRTVKGGYSGWRKMWARVKPSAFELRFSPMCRDFAGDDLPVRNPYIRFHGVL